MNLFNHYYYFTGVIPHKICDDIVRYGKTLSDQMALTGGLGADPKKLNKISLQLNNSIVDYFQIVKWPAPNEGKSLHTDVARSHTSLSSIIYLNDEFEGGHTYFEDGTSFAPLTGRAIFFDGQYFVHGVSKIKNKDRYTVATWFKKNEF